MMKKTAIVLLWCLVLPTLLLGQGETANWYFGNNAGITFNNDGTVTATNDGKLNTYEGCATISDPRGNLLFYTDGIRVFNRDHVIMENGSGLYGDPSSTQSAIIVPKPEDPNVFYIFTVDTAIDEEDPDRGLNYSIVDIGMNDGLGEVTQKNVPLLKDCSEKIAAVIKDCSDQSIWVITLATASGERGLFNTFHAFEVSTQGVNTTAVKTTLPDLAIEDPRGYLKISVDGTKMASANAASGLFLYDLDAKTGIISEQQRITINGTENASYGVEFSPNGRYLYVHASNDQITETGHLSSLVQFDLESANISASQVVLDSRPIYRGALQLGENGKIYRTIAENYLRGTTFLGVINSPNTKGGGANYRHNAISLGPNNGTQGLPPFIQSFFNTVDLITDANGNKINSLALCSGERFQLEAENIPGASYVWEKDGLPLMTSTNHLLEIPIATNTDGGRYRLTVTLEDPQECPILGEAFIEIATLPETSALVFTQCEVEINGAADGISSFDLNELIGNTGYQISFYENTRDRDNERAIENPENYTNTTAFNQTIVYQAINRLGCESEGEIVLQSSPTALNESHLSPLLACDNDSGDTLLVSTFNLEDIDETGYPDATLIFYETLADLELQQNPISGNFTTGNTTLYLRVQDGNQCLAVEQLEVIVNPIPEFELEDVYEVCSDGEPLRIDGPIGYDSYRWYAIAGTQETTIGTNIEITITDGGTYGLEVGTLYEKNGQTNICTAQSDFNVIQSNKAVFQDIEIEDASKNNTIEIMVTGDGDYEFSLNSIDYQDQNYFDNIDAGFYTAFVRDKNGCGIATEEVAIIGFPKFFTPNGDGHNDQWEIIGVREDTDLATTITIFDKYGKLIVQFNSQNASWDGTFQGTPLPASDYWFKVAFNNRKELTGHFTLKR